MREEIIKSLSVMSKEEIGNVNECPSQQVMYSSPGRFIVERRKMSNIFSREEVAAVCMSMHPRFRVFPEHTHDYVEIMYVVCGTVTHVIRGTEVSVTAGDMIVLGKNTKHSINLTAASDIGVNIIISEELFEILLNTVRTESALNTHLLEKLLDRDSNSFCVFKTSSSIEVSNLLENMIYSELICKNSDGYLLEQSVKLLVCYLCSLSETALDAEWEDSYTEQVKKKIIKYIRTSYSTATLTESAHLLGLSPSYLSRWICASFGMSFKELLMRERFLVAADLLRTTDMPIGDIIIHTGYENSSYFHKQFKKRFGMTPNEYRKQREVIPKK